MSQKAVKSISVTLAGTAYKVLEAPPNGGQSSDAIVVSDFSDATEVRIPHPQSKLSAIKLILADDGTAVPPPVGVIQAAVITTTYTDGTTDTTVPKTVTGWISKAEPTNIQHAGERRAAWDCEFTPCGFTTTTTSHG